MLKHIIEIAIPILANEQVQDWLINSAIVFILTMLGRSKYVSEKNRARAKSMLNDGAALTDITDRTHFTLDQAMKLKREHAAGRDYTSVFGAISALVKAIVRGWIR